LEVLQQQEELIEDEKEQEMKEEEAKRAIKEEEEARLAERLLPESEVHIYHEFCSLHDQHLHF
jgi:LETM1 and EF-hand domain-containing protein 1, mitochondrial